MFENLKPGGTTEDVAARNAEIQKERERLMADARQIIEASKPASQSKNFLDLEVSKAVMEIASSDERIESTTNLRPHERDEMLKLIQYYTYNRNPRVLITYFTYMRLNRSLTERIINFLENIFSLPRVEEEHVGRFGRFKQFVGGR